MDAARWERLNELFHGAIGLDAAERRAWLDRGCAGDRTLLAEVERLVQAHERASGFIGTTESQRVVQAARDAPAVPAFRGTERFVVQRELGVGGMGVVYAVFDRARDQVVALKTLFGAQPAAIYRLKREFRGLADVAHENLVSLYELFVEDGRCFFTMELVDGVDFVEAVRPSPGVLDVPRLRGLLEQLVDGVSELHRRGKLHRDIKPSNVLVTAQDRLVILDFGLISEIAGPGAGPEALAGTPAYMAPEQGLGRPASQASDWYGVGVTLFEALTGERPFQGPGGQVFRLKIESDPPAAVALSPDVPEDLDAVCAGLLRRDPRERLTGDGALRRLGRRGGAAGASAPAHETPFVGRRWQLDVLRDSFAATRQGRAAGVYVCGPSGIGKSALVRSFLERLPAGGPVAVLAGRCYENESVPYKALDGVVDSLSQHLASLSRATAGALVPADASALARLFPVLGRVEAVALAPPAEPDADPVLLRRRAFAALRELLAGMARLHPVVISIDDLHWADADSAVLLEELLLRDDSPAVLIVACFRTEEMAAKPFLAKLLAGGDKITALPLAPMTDEEARELIAAVLPGPSAVPREVVARMAREAEGNPFFLEQIARHVAHGHGARAEEPTLAEMLEARLRALPEEARAFLETLALCGRPMAPPLVGEAAGLGGRDRPAVAVLRSASFVRSSGSGERIEVYHDRIRETLVAGLLPHVAARRHLGVAEALVARGIDDAEALFEHYRAGGDGERACACAVRAAQRASDALAFDRAVLFYRHALELAPARPPEWREALARALANAGRPAEAGRAFVEAARDAAGPARLDLQRRAADQFLIGGHIEEGVGVMRAVLDSAGMRLPRGVPGALASVLVQKARLRWRGLAFAERAASDVPPELLRRVDICWSVMNGLSMVYSVPAWLFHVRHLRLALEAGEPYRIARALAAEAGFRAAQGGGAGRRPAEFADRAAALARRIGHPHAIALSTLMAGLVALLCGQWKEATRQCDRALTLLRDTCVGFTWELNMAQAFLFGSLLYRGEIQEVSRALPPALTAARDRGNLYLEGELRTRFMSLVLLAADDPSQAERQSDEVMARWWRGGFTRQHYNHVLGRGITALYRGDAPAAWRVVAENGPVIRRELLWHMQIVRIEMAFLRGRSALAMAGHVGSGASGGGSARRFLSVARRAARRVAREKMPWGDGFAALLRAGVAHLEGEAREAEGRLAEAVGIFDRADMKLYAAGARRRLGILRGEDGRALVRAAEEWMAAEGVRNPRAMTRMIAPGFPDG